MTRIASICAALIVACASGASAQITVKVNDKWAFTFSGNVNAFYFYSRATANSTVDGGLVSAPGNRSSIGTGLLPAFAKFAAVGHERGLDFGAHFGFAPEVQQGGAASFFGNQSGGAQLDVRQVYLTFGGPWGQVLVGKELGLYQRQNLLTDITLFGAGTTLNGRGTALGRIGIGYIYPDFRAQFTYSTPAGRPLQIAVGVFDPTVLAGDVSYGQIPTPRGESEVSYTEQLGRSSNLLLFASGAVQQAKTFEAPVQTVTARGGSVGAKLDIGGLSLSGSGYLARGLGTTFPGSVSDGNTITGTAIGADGRPRRSFGYIGQVTYRIPTSPLTIGGSYGASRLDANPGDASTLVERNDSYVGLVEYRAAQALRFVGEFTHSEARNQTRTNANRQNQGAIGALLFF